MLRLSRFIQSTLSRNFLFFSRPNSSMISQIRGMFFFSSSQAQQTILDRIKNETNESNLDRIFTQMGGLDDKLREEAIREVIQRVINCEFSPSVLVNEKFNTCLRKYPMLLYEAYFFRIVSCSSRLIYFMENEEEKGKKMVVKEMNDCFSVCFDTIKKMPSDEAPLKEIDLYKVFAHYHSAFLSQLVEPQKIKSCFTKSKDFYKATLTKIAIHVKTLLEQEKKLATSINPQESGQEKTKRQDTIRIIQDNKFQLFQSFGETLIEIVDVERELQQLRSKEPKVASIKPQIKPSKSLSKQTKSKDQQVQEQIQVQYQYSKNVIEMDSIIEKGILNYKLVKDRNHTSRFYHKLKQLLLEISFEKKLREIQDSTKTVNQKEQLILQNEQDLITEMEELFQQSFQDFKKLCNQSKEKEELTEFALILIGIKMQRFQRSEETDENMLKQIGGQVQKIVSLIEDQTLRKEVLHAIVKNLKSNFEINIERYVEKLPRGLRHNRSRRIQDLLE